MSRRRTSISEVRPTSAGPGPLPIRHFGISARWPSAPIEGPTHFSQFDPLAEQVWGQRWFETGTLSAHFQTMVIGGEQVQASLTTTGDTSATIEAHKPDGTPVLVGTASIGPDHPPSELD